MIMCLGIAICAMTVPALAQPKGKSDKNDKGGGQTTQAVTPKAKVTKEGGQQKFDFGGMNLDGKMRTPQLLYFLERANEELERASLEKRSFIPHMVRSVEEEQL
jgi:hypothetical protein